MTEITFIQRNIKVVSTKLLRKFEEDDDQPRCFGKDTNDAT